MKTIAIYTLTLLISFNVFSIETGVLPKIDSQKQLSQISTLATNPQKVQTIHLSQEASSVELSSADKQDELFNEFAVSVLIILVYYFYWLHMKWF